ncbi:winged helix-turn-helix domain-containing protein [Streptomyces sp. NPDC002659]|uniref:winged helix-turn-helix domain-containing protein n=1 Tax=Streptomyces sp. NPDC002659 TaxID=3364656 RepID=UPI0036C2522C
MRYAQGGGLGPRDQAARERIRLLAAQGFDRGEKNRVIAKELRVSVRSVERWRRSWREQGLEALRSSGPAKRPKVSAEEFAVLEVELLKGSVVHGWPDERWTLSRVAVVIEHRLGIFLSVRGVWELLQRHGWSCQQPARRAGEQDQAAVAGWVKETWPAAKPPRRRSGHGSSLRTKPPSR